MCLIFMTMIFRLIVWEHVLLNSTFLLHADWDYWTFRLLVDDRDLEWIFVHLSRSWCICFFLSLLYFDEISQVLYGWLSTSLRIWNSIILLAFHLPNFLVWIAFSFRQFLWSGVRNVLIQIVKFGATNSCFHFFFCIL